MNLLDIVWKIRFQSLSIATAITICSVLPTLVLCGEQTDKRVRHVLIYDDPANVESQLIKNPGRHQSDSFISYVGYGEVLDAEDLTRVITPFLNGPFTPDHALDLEWALERYFTVKGTPLDVVIPDQSRAQEFLRLVIEGVAMHSEQRLNAPDVPVEMPPAKVKAEPPAKVKAEPPAKVKAEPLAKVKPEPPVADPVIKGVVLLGERHARLCI